MKRKLINIILISMFSAAMPAEAAFSTNYAGTSAAKFLKIDVGARASAMGGAYGAVGDDVTAMYWNPAGLNYIKNNQLSIMYSMWFHDISYQYVAVAHPTGIGVFSVGANYLSMGSIQKVNNIGVELNDNFSPAYLSANFSYASSFGGVLRGINIKYIQSKIDEKSATSVAFDAGVLNKFFNDRFTVGVAIQNLGLKMKFNYKYDPLPFNIKMSGSYDLNIAETDIKTALDVNLPRDNSMLLNLGLEVKRDFKGMILMPRAGFKSQLAGIKGFSGLCAGFGVGLGANSINYAWVPYGELGNTHRISLLFGF